jgi:hypothetical protein
MKKLVAALVLGALLVSVGVGCGNPTTPAKPPTTGTDKSKETDKTKTP